MDTFKHKYKQWLGLPQLDYYGAPDYAYRQKIPSNNWEKADNNVVAYSTDLLRTVGSSWAYKQTISIPASSNIQVGWILIRKLKPTPAIVVTIRNIQRSDYYDIVIGKLYRSQYGSIMFPISSLTTIVLYGTSNAKSTTECCDAWFIPLKPLEAGT